MDNYEEELYQETDIMTEDDVCDECDEEVLADEAENFDVQQIRVSRGDPLKMYLADIARYPRLTKEEEIELGKRKDAGDAVARERLINCNMRLVVALAKKKYDAISCLNSISTTLEDLIQEGAMGLITAVDRYDWTKNCKFSTKAVYWINHAIMDGISQNARTIRLPDHKIEEISVIKKAINELYKVLERNPMTNEIAAYLNFKFTETEVNNLLNIINGSTIVSLSTPLGDDEEDGEMGDMIADTSETPEEYAARVALQNSIQVALDSLPEKERLVIQYAFGLGDYEKTTLDDIASILYEHGYTNREGEKITKEGVRQLREKALAMMKPLISY